MLWLLIIGSRKSQIATSEPDSSSTAVDSRQVLLCASTYICSQLRCCFYNLDWPIVQCMHLPLISRHKNTMAH